MLSNQNIPSREFFAPLHGLRGIAVLYVVISHLGNSGLFLIPITHNAIGKVGVWIFFSLSAFLLTTHLCRSLANAENKLYALLQYALNRVFRIFPLYIIILIIHSTLGSMSVEAFYKHLLLIEGSGELWAIPVEFQYYLVIPLIAIGSVYLEKKRILYVVLAMGIFASLYDGITNPTSVFSNNLTIIPKLLPFFLGSVVALLPLKILPLAKNQSQKILFASIYFAAIISVTILYRCLSKDCVPNSSAPWISLAIGVIISGLIYTALQPNVISTFLSFKILVFIGEISFSLYLLHMLVITFVMRHSHFSSTTEAWLSLLLSITLSIFTYYFIERPGILAGKKIGLKLWPTSQSPKTARRLGESGL